MTIAIIAACTLVQLYTVEVAPSPDEVEQQIAARMRDMPASPDQAQQAAAERDVERIARQLPSVRFGYRTGSGVNYRLVTAAFVHEGWLHLIGNMLFLWLVGAALEDRWGRGKFAAFYAAGAVASTLCFSAFHQGDEVLLIGASGAISALMGAFLLHFARTKIHFIYLLGPRLGRFDASAYVALPLWLAEQVIFAMADGERGDGVAFTAHIGGFAFGFAAVGAARLLARARGSADATQPGATSAALPQPDPRRRPAPAPRPIEPPRPAPPRDPADGPRFLV